MSKILRKLQVARTGNRVIGSMDKMPVCSAVDVRVAPMSDAHPMLEEYVAELRIGTSFVCNSAQYDHALHNAKKSLMRHLYRDIHEIIHDLRSAMYAENLEELDEAISKLESTIN